jgi:hypothetical protein
LRQFDGFPYWMTKKRACRLALALAAVCLHAAVPTGPEVGQHVPGFRLPDQNGVERTLQSVLGPKGALLVFFRSADW